MPCKKTTTIFVVEEGIHGQIADYCFENRIAGHSEAVRQLVVAGRKKEARTYTKR